MNCQTIEDFNAAIENAKSINDVRKDQTAETTIRFLKNTSNNVSKIEGKYRTGINAPGIKESVTEMVSRKTKSGKVNDIVKQQGEVGNYIHDILEHLVFGIVNVTNTMSNSSAYDYIKNLDSFDTEGVKKISLDYGKQISDQAIQNLVLGVKDTLLNIYRIQRTINKLTNTSGTVHINPEQVVIDPRGNIGGTIDLIAIFSDNTAAVIDFKTKILKSSNRDIHGNILDPKKTVTEYDLERYRLQTGEYGRILRDSYGVKSIRNITLYPISLDVKFDVKTQTYSDQIEALKFPGQDPFLEKVFPFSNKTGFKELDEYIGRLDTRINKLRQRIKSDYKLRDELQPKIDQLELAKKQIFQEHSLDGILAFGKTLSKQIKEAELNQLSIPDLQELLEELNLLETLTESTKAYRDFLRNTSAAESIEKLEENISKMSTDIKDRIADVKDILFKDKIASLIENRTGFSILDETGEFIPFAQEGFFGKWFYQLSKYDNPVFQTLKKILNEINFETRQKTDVVVEEITRLENKLESWRVKSGKSYKDIVDIFINPQTDNFWGRYKPEYIEFLRSANGNTLFRYYEPTEDYATQYSERFEKAKELFIKDGLTGDSLNYAIKNWVSKNDLSIVDGKPVYPEAWELALKFHRLQMKDAPDQYNDNYKYITSIPELKTYYDMFEKYNKIFRKLLGVTYTQLPNNFLPNIRKTMSERISEHGMLGLKEGVEDFLKDFSIREEDRSEDTTYNSNEQIPIFFLNRFKSNDGQLQVGEKSYQFGRSLAIFAKMAYNYEASTKREAEILALQQFLTTEAEQLVQSRGKNMIDKMGNQLSEKLQASELPEIFKAFVDMYIYKVNVKASIGDKSGKVEKMLLKAKEYFTLKVLGFNIIAGAGSFVSAGINSIIERNKGIIYNKESYNESVTESWSNRDKFLAINAFFDPMSHRLNNPRLGGETKYGERFYSDPTMKGWVNKYVNSRMLMNTFSVGDQYIEELVTVAMSKRFYVDELGNLKRIKNDAELEKFKDRTIYNLFEYSKENGPKLNIPDNQLQRVFEDFRVAVQTGQSRIKGTIPEEDKAYWQNNIFGQLLMHFKSWMPGIFFERFGKIKYDHNIQTIYMGKYTALSKEFTNPDKLALNTYFKGILFPRIAKLILDVTTFGLMSKSRLNDKVNKEMIFEQWLDNNPHYKGKISFEEFNEVQQKQLKSIIQELRVLLVFAGLIVLMGIDWDDDGEKDYKKYFLTRKLASLIFKTQQELAFVYSPVAFASMVKSPLPMLGLVNDAWKTMMNAFDELLDAPFGEERLIGGQTKDNQNLFYNTIKWAPGAGGVTRFIDLFNDDIQYLNIQQ